MTTDELLSDILRREGGYVDHPADTGGPTNYGITAATLGAWRNLGTPASADSVKSLTPEEARAIYRARYVEAPGFARIRPDYLQAQLVDWGVNSGPARAIRWLQRTLDVPANGVLDARTTAALAQSPPGLVNNALVAARLTMIARIVAQDASQAVFVTGWNRRALEFARFA